MHVNIIAYFLRSFYTGGRGGQGNFDPHMWGLVTNVTVRHSSLLLATRNTISYKFHTKFQLKRIYYETHIRLFKLNESTGFND